MQIVAEHATWKISDQDDRPFLTGYFRDGKRRIDLVLVLKGSSLQTLKTSFIANMLSMGMELEIEAGVSYEHRDLIFVKVHGSEHTIRHFGYLYNVRKYFKSSHNDLISDYIYCEKELISTCRSWYGGPGNYSPMERSTIVYKALMSCPFGRPANYVGLNQLLDRRIVLDAFPLHDGPYQLAFGQTPLELNARQALYHCWCGYNNLLRAHPVHLIREYFGERVGFLFVLYQLYNWALGALGLLGLFFFLDNSTQYRSNPIQINEYGQRNYYIYNKRSRFKERNIYYADLPVCPRCRDLVACPFRNLSASGPEVAIRSYLANPNNFTLLFIVALWGILFYIIYVRFENYFYWCWECTADDAKTLVRPGYRIAEKPSSLVKPYVMPPVRLNRFGRPKDKVMAPSKKLVKVLEKSKSKVEPGGGRAAKNVGMFAVMLAVLLFILLVYVPLSVVLATSMLNRLRYVEDRLGLSANLHQLNHFTVDALASIDGVYMLVADYLWFKAACWLAAFDNPRSEWQLEETLAVNLFGVSFLINTVMVMYYAFLKGSLYTTPNEPQRWAVPLGLGMMHCGPLSCIDEAFIFFAATFKTKIALEEVYLWFQSDADDRPLSPKDRTPVWEREFNLKPTGEEFYWEIVKRILVQCCVVTSFMTLFQLGPLFAFIWNIWHIRYLSEQLVKYRRRPLVLQTWGLGGFRRVLFAIPYIACFCNALLLARHNTLMHTRYNRKYWGHQPRRRFLADYYMSFFNVTDGSLPRAVREAYHQYNSTFDNHLPDFCLFPGAVSRLVTFQRPASRVLQLHVGQYLPAPGHYYILWHQALLLILPMIAVAVLGGVVYYVVGPRCRQVADTQYAERCVRRYDIARDAMRVPRRTTRDDDEDEEGEGDGARGQGDG